MPNASANAPDSSKSTPHTDALATLFALQENLHASYTMELKELEDRLATHPALSAPWQAMKAFLRQPGKRVRPMLFLLSYSLFNRQDAPPPRAIYRVASALELFHGFALVHDDLIDQSNSRRGKPTLHRRLAQDVLREEDNAEHLALVLGDILFGFAMERFLDPDLPPAPAQEAMREFLRVAQETGIGQAVEIAHLERSLGDIREHEIERTYHLKTTRYTVECPLVLGAMLAGADATAIATLRDFARPLGLAFQIENDLHEVELLPATAPELAYDLQRGVKTLLLKRLHDTLPPYERARLVDALARADEPRRVAVIADLLARSGVAERLRRETKRRFADARHALRESSLNPAEARALESVLAYLQGNRHHSESPALAQSA